MPFDYESLLIAIVFCGSAMSLTLLSAWLTAKEDKFLLSWSIGMLVLVAAVGGFNLYSATASVPVGGVAFTLLPIGCAMLWGSAGQFRRGVYPLQSLLISCAALSIGVGTPFAMGWTGVGIIVANASAGGFLSATGFELWRLRRESPALIICLSGLYLLAAISFALCATVLARQGDLRLIGMPRNWAEDLNAFVSIVCVTGIGAISIALNQSRAALRHQREARTDQLTSLMNRRFLFDLFPQVTTGTSVILFDLDNFKAVNDTFGHAAGDEVLRAFGNLIRAIIPVDGAAARIGGEEFALVLQRCDAGSAIRVADDIRSRFRREPVLTINGPLHVTASAGIAHAGDTSCSLDQLLLRADQALYKAKADGRDRVTLEKLRLVQA